MAAPPVVEIERRARAAAAWPRGTAAAVALAAAATVGAAALLGGWLELPAVVLRAAALAVAGGAIFLWLAVRRLRAPRFGAANSVTLLRAALAVLLAALVGAAPSAALGWVIVGLGTAGVALDGVDGALARHRDEAGTFGARFDMETDALLILVLAALVWQQGKAGAWILTAGLLRYLFVAAGWLIPWLAAPLTPTIRGKAAAVVQMVTLAIILVLPSTLAWTAAALSLAVLVWSFAIDVRRLWRARPGRSSR